ncbi:40-kDa huntingtin-associated protein-like [Coccinella septempunctata]|uniref:40-kDa huntingtin-associated protein-like n=1 Tax=Coccinella septempunctata TaxID=41139 RepID=UPI001D098BD7|nr:40-kDa huntingtin-associated protein-like [Coccinella septempunctata]
MASDTTRIEILDQYRSISKKLKRTFFKKPNEHEALESYVDLAREWENLDLPAYAGLSWHAAAKCENALGNTVGEITNLLRSARSYAKNEVNNLQTGCISLEWDMLQASLISYTSAISKYKKDSPQAVALNLEVANLLRIIGKSDSAENFLKTALDHCVNGESLKIYCLNLLASNYIKAGNYVAALESFTEVHNILQTLPNNGENAQILMECEINRILLLLILKPPPQKLTSDLTQVLERYTWGDKNDDSIKNCQMSEYIFSLLESLVTTCQSADTSSLNDLEKKLWPLLNRNQRDLLRVLVQIYYL